jgi:hypothetical protein
MIDFDKMPEENKIRLEETAKSIIDIMSKNTGNLSEEEFKKSLAEAEKRATKRINEDV